MAGTFSQIYVQYVFALKGRENLLQKPWREEVLKYMSGIIKGKGYKPIIVNGVEDHVHVFVGLKPAMSISDLVRDIKNNSSNFINEQKFITRKFSLFINTLPIRKNITRRKHLKKNTLIFCRNSR